MTYLHKNFLAFVFAIITCIGVTSCEFQPPPKSCTDIFKMVNLTITGQQLDSFYTIRISSNDTIRNQKEGEDYYPVLNDRYQDALANSQDSFQFVGLINDSIVVVEPYVFGADDCHIHKISGKESIQL